MMICKVEKLQADQRSSSSPLSALRLASRQRLPPRPADLVACRHGPIVKSISFLSLSCQQ